MPDRLTPQALRTHADAPMSVAWASQARALLAWGADLLDAAENLQQESHTLRNDLTACQLERDRLQRALRAVYEVWAGSDGMVPETAPEAYQDCLTMTLTAAQQRQIARDAELGMTWWNRLTERERAEWLRLADTTVPAEAWDLFKRQQFQP